MLLLRPLLMLLLRPLLMPLPLSLPLAQLRPQMLHLVVTEMLHHKEIQLRNLFRMRRLNKLPLLPLLLPLPLLNKPLPLPLLNKPLLNKPLPRLPLRPKRSVRLRSVLPLKHKLPLKHRPLLTLLLNRTTADRVRSRLDNERVMFKMKGGGSRGNSLSPTFHKYS